MSRSLTIARIAGVPLRLHFTFFLLAVLVALAAVEAGASEALADVVWLVVLFASVTAHELSHCLVARRLGLKVREIVLLPIGGVSQIEGMDLSSAIEWRVALAGPVSSILIGAVLLGLAAAVSSGMWPPSLYQGSWLARIGWLNLLLAAFNLLPALPMDGGRVMRALLQKAAGRLRATEIASAVAGMLAAAMVAYGLERNYFVVLIGLFVGLGAHAEWRSARLRQSLTELKVALLMHHDPTTASDLVRSGDLAQWLSLFPGRGVPLVDDAGVYAGIVDARDLAHLPPETPAGSATAASVPYLSPATPLYPEAVSAFESARRDELAVLDGGQVVGVLYRGPVADALARAMPGLVRAGRS